jgi:hypothetical protein
MLAVILLLSYVSSAQQEVEAEDERKIEAEDERKKCQIVKKVR